MHKFYENQRSKYINVKESIEQLQGRISDATFSADIANSMQDGKMVLDSVSKNLNVEDIDEMIREIKGYKILTGVRGEKAKDIEAIKGVLAKLSEIVIDNPEINELDLNPVIVHEKGLSIVDSRVLIG